MIIEAYVSTATPVGSAYVSRKLGASLSPATIRHVMVELEGAGLLEQPHTSAGRVPTDRGYRFYVDAVMDPRHLSPDEQREMEALLEQEEGDLEALLERACEVISGLTQQAGFVVAPTVKQRRVKQIELVPLGLRKVLCVLIANEEIIASHVVETEEPLSRDEAAALARFISTELVGLTFAALVDSLKRRLLAETDSFYYQVKRSLDLLEEALSTEPNERLLLDGMSHVIAQPEFSRDSRKARGLLKGLDAHEALLERVRQDIAPDGVRVCIGDELHLQGLEDCSTLTAPFGIHAEIIGGVGVLGPKRMDYPRVHALVEAMGRCLSGILARWSRV